MNPPVAVARSPRKSKLERQLEQEIRELVDIRAGAKAKGAFGPAATASAKIAELSKDLDALRDARLGSKITDPIEAIRRARIKAEGDGSHQAVARLAAQEAALLDARRQAEREAAAVDPLEEMTADDLLSMVRDIVDSLPDLFAEELAEHLADRVGLRLVEAEADE